MYYLRFQFLTKFICCTLLLFVSSPSFAKQQVAPSNPEREAAIKLLDEGKNTEAIQSFRSYLKNSQHREDAEVWLYLGIAQYRNNQSNNAKESLKQAIKFNPNSDAAHSNYALVLYAIGKIKDAEKETEQALQLNSKNSTAIYLRGVLSYSRGDYYNSLIDADTVLKLTPQFASAYLLKAQAILGYYYSNKSKGADLSDSLKKAFSESASNIEKYLQTAPLHSGADFWRERLTSLRYYTSDQPPSVTCPSISDIEGKGTKPEIFYRERAVYTDEARKNRIQGTITLHAILDIDGRVKNIIPISYLDGGLTNQAIQAAQKIRFKPATKNGQPVCIGLFLEYSFHLL